MKFRMQELMDEQGLTQERMAGLMNCSVGQVNQILSGKRGKWITEWLPRIAEALNAEVWELFIPKDQLSESSSSSEKIDRDLLLKYFDYILQEKENGLEGLTPRTMTEFAMLAYDEEIDKYKKDPEGYEVNEDMVRGLIMGAFRAA